MTITVINAKPGAAVSITLTGTDFYHATGTIPLGMECDLPVPRPGGLTWDIERAKKLPGERQDVVRFKVHGASFPGVVDTIEATVDGTKVTRKAKYTF